MKGLPDMSEPAVPTIARVDAEDKVRGKALFAADYAADHAAAHAADTMVTAD